MGQALKTLNPGDGEKKAKGIESELENYYDTHFGGSEKEWSEWTFADFYRAVAEIVEEINKSRGGTQLRVPSIDKLNEVYVKHAGSGQEKLSKDEFRELLQEVMIGTWFTGVGGIKECLFFVFGVPAAALFVKNRVAPGSVPNDFFIPAVTSATVFLLAKLNKL